MINFPNEEARRKHWEDWERCFAMLAFFKFWCRIHGMSDARVWV